MSCCTTQIKAIHTYVGDTLTSSLYLDMRTSPPTTLTQEEYDILILVKCPETTSDWENICIQPLDNIDTALIEQGMKCVTKTIKYSDTSGTVDEVTIDSVSLHQSDGTDVTDTYEETTCPVPTVIESGACVVS